MRGTLTQLPAGFGAWSVVVSPSGNRVALLGTDELIILVGRESVAEALRWAACSIACLP
ncbi:hypothetical protein [Propioniciclava sinopodophylli]|uniref:hypothetical protein n=1 Tax=Propioniciclava sinopodophylli TaxID=1837344 RepID=UPI002490F71E|nr:hypothetical protein [Propioniciclava sinopodophylli]